MNSVRRSDPGDPLLEKFGEHICRSYETRGVDLEFISMFEVTERITTETITDAENRASDRIHIYRHHCR